MEGGSVLIAIWDKTSAIASRLHSAILRPLAMLAFALGYCLLLEIARFYWYVPAGWRFAALALLPWHYWPWILGGELASRIWYEYVFDPPLASQAPLPEFFLTLSGLVFLFAGPAGGALGSLLWRWRARNPRIALENLGGMGWFVIAALLGAVGETVGNLLSIHLNDDVLPIGLGRFVVGKLTGDYIGVIALAPGLLALAKRHWAGERWMRDAIGVALVLAGYVALVRTDFDNTVYGYLRILVLAPTFCCAIRHGWRGAALALTVSSFVVALAPSLHPLDAYHDLFTQMLLAVFGTAALLLGSAVDAQRTVQADLALQNAALESANAGLDHLGTELREAAQRNLRMEEEQRRRIATEIHDELGQNLTAVHTRVKLAADRLNAAQLGDVTTSIYEILATMRGSVRGLMDSLRPPVLDEFGLLRALREGPLRDLIERAGLRYEFDLRGDPTLIAALDEGTQIAIWRIVQEAATNTVRHARATSFRARLRVGVRGANALAILDLRDDGIGIADATAASRGGHGLQGMRDRALALNGLVRVVGNRKGTRLRVLLRQAL